MGFLDEVITFYKWLSLLHSSELLWFRHKLRHSARIVLICSTVGSPLLQRPSEGFVFLSQSSEWYSSSGIDGTGDRPAMYVNLTVWISSGRGNEKRLALQQGTF